MLSLRLLGVTEFYVNGETAGGDLLGKDLALLYYLAVTGQPQPRTSLSVLLWGDASESAARANLRKSISALNRVLGASLVIARDRVALDGKQCTIDTHAFEQMAQEGQDTGNVHLLHSAVDLYHGEFLAGFSVRNAPDYDLWMYQMQEKYRGLAVRALDALARHWGATTPGQAVSCLQRLIALEPWNEEAHRNLMQVLASTGQRSAALLQYRACVDCLTTELGVRPGIETQELYQRIRDNQLPVRPQVAEITPTPAQLSPQTIPLRGVATMTPVDLTPMIGRERELEELTELLASPDCRLISIVGMGGVGKSRLALALAATQRANYATTAYVPLATVDAAEDIMPAVTTLVQPVLSHDTLDLHDRHPFAGSTLLILDNFEHLIPHGIPVLATLLTESPHLRCVITSRTALGAPWEWRFDLQELTYPVLKPGDELHFEDYGAIQMFLQVARRMRARHPIQPNEMSQVARICQLVGGMPLGIEFAAAQVGRLPLSRIADQVESQLESLEAMPNELPHPPQSLRASFESSWRTLSPEEQRVLASLAVVRGEFTLEAALSIADATISSILRLSDKSMLRLNSADRYSLHEVIRRFAEQKLEQRPGDQAAAFERYCAYYVALAGGYAAAIATRQDAPTVIAGKLRNLIQHLRLITHRLAGQPGAGAATTALTNTQVALSSCVLRIITDTATDALTLLEITHSHTTAEFNQPNDIVVSDVIWLPSVHAELLDLTEHFGLEQHELIPDLAEICRIEGRLVAFPYVLDLGLLYYRRDLLERHGFGAPPQTWDELTVMASAIQASERAAGHAEFWGYLWQGQISERLVCNALEWQHAEGGGTIVEPTGTISVNNLRVQHALERARSWIGSISPPDIVQYNEAHTVKAWMKGNGAFMRLWTTPFSMWPAPAYRAAGANLVDVTGVTLLPSGATRRAATLGGWPFAIRRDSRDRASALNLIGALASPEAQRQRALLDEFQLPSLRRLYFDAEISAKHPLTTEVLDLIEAGGLAIRPANVAGDLYPHVANAYSRAVAKILYDGADPAETLVLLEEQLMVIGGWPVQRLA